MTYQCRVADPKCQSQYSAGAECNHPPPSISIVRMQAPRVPYAKAHIPLLLDSEVSPGAKVYLLLLHHTSMLHGGQFHSQEARAELMSTSVRTVQRYEKELVESKYIEIRRPEGYSGECNEVLIVDESRLVGSDDEFFLTRRQGRQNCRVGSDQGRQNCRVPPDKSVVSYDTREIPKVSHVPSPSDSGGAGGSDGLQNQDDWVTRTRKHASDRTGHDLVVEDGATGRTVVKDPKRRKITGGGSNYLTQIEMWWRTRFAEVHGEGVDIPLTKRELKHLSDLARLTGRDECESFLEFCMSRWEEIRAVLKLQRERVPGIETIFWHRRILIPAWRRGVLPEIESASKRPKEVFEQKGYWDNPKEGY